MTWEQLQQLIAEVGEGWMLYPAEGRPGTWVLERPDIAQMLPFTTPEELIAYLRQYAERGEPAPTPTPTPAPATPTPPAPPPAPAPNALQGVQDWFTGLPKGATPEVPMPKPIPAPPGGPVYPPEEPADWQTLMPGYNWEYMYEPVTDKREFLLDSAGKAVKNPDYNRVTSYKPSSRYTSWWGLYVKAKAEAAAPPKPEKAPAKRPPYAEGPEYEGPDALGNTWYRSGPDDEWKLLSKSKARTLTEALTDAILAEKPDQAEIDRLMGIINEIEASSPNFIANEQQRAFTNRLAMRDQALQEQQRQIELARSPGDWLTWWSMMNRANQPTAEEFQRFGEERFAPGMEGVFQPQGAQVPMTAQGEMFAPAKNVGYGTAQFAAAQKAVQDEVEMRYQAWLGQAQGVSLENLTPEMLANARVGIEAQVKKEFPLPEALSFTGGYGTTNRAIYEEYQRRMKEGTPYQKTAVAQAQAGAPIGARTGLDWLTVARSGQPIPEPRLAPNIPGVPAFPNPQTYGNLLPSQKEAYKASVEMQGIPFEDYWKQYQEQLPKGYVPPGYMFRPKPGYIRR